MLFLLRRSSIQRKSAKKKGCLKKTGKRDHRQVRVDHVGKKKVLKLVFAKPATFALCPYFIQSLYGILTVVTPLYWVVAQ